MFGWRSKPGVTKAPAADIGAADKLIAEGNRLEDAGNLARACQLYREAVALAPGHAKAHVNLGIGLEATGDDAGAKASYETALECDAANWAAAYNLGKLLYSKRSYSEARRLLERALEARPDFPEARIVQGYVLHALGQLDAAVRELEAGLEKRPDDSAARARLAALLGAKALQAARQGHLEEAVATYRRLLAAQPTDAVALCNLGTALKDLGRRGEALDCYRKAIEAAPRFADAHYNLGVALRDEGRAEEAAAEFRRGIELRPEMADLHFGLGHALRDGGRNDEAIGSFDRALARDPDHVQARWSRMIARIPAVPAFGEDPLASREAFTTDLADLEQWFHGGRLEQAATAVGTDQPFELAYHEQSNRPLLERYGALCARLMEHWRQRQGVPLPAARIHQPLRVGIVSAHLRNHSVWSAITRGWFEGLDSRRFQLYAFHLGVDEDAETAYARSRAAHYERGPKTLAQWVERIRAHEPDVLIYPEVGIDPMTVRLASLRLAPRQVATWGHPETTGLPTIDYYLSAQDLEPADAEQYYSERLVRLPHLGCAFKRIAAAPATADLAQVEAGADTPLLICPGVPFKYAPQHDYVFPQIAQRLGDCRFIFFRHRTRIFSERLERRLRSVFEAQGLPFERFVKFIPWQPAAGFMGWLRAADVYLDTIGFSGFNTALYAVEAGLPIVNRDGRFLRGRLAGGILRRLELPELVVPDEEAYVDLAVKLASDEAFNTGVRSRMRRNCDALYDDAAPVRALEEFLGQGW